MEKVNKNGDDNTNNSEKNILKRRSSRVMFNKKLMESTELPKIMQSKHDVHHKKEVKRTTTIKAKSAKVNQNQNLNPLEAIEHIKMAIAKIDARAKEKGMMSKAMRRQRQNLLQQLQLAQMSLIPIIECKPCGRPVCIKSKKTALTISFKTPILPKEYKVNAYEVQYCCGRTLIEIELEEEKERKKRRRLMKESKRNRRKTDHEEDPNINANNESSSYLRKKMKWKSATATKFQRIGKNKILYELKNLPTEEAIVVKVRAQYAGKGWAPWSSISKIFQPYEIKKVPLKCKRPIAKTRTLREITLTWPAPQSLGILSYLVEKAVSKGIHPKDLELASSDDEDQEEGGEGQQEQEDEPWSFDELIWESATTETLLENKLVLTNLRNGINYRFRIRSMNKYGWSEPGDISEEINLLPAPPAPPLEPICLTSEPRSITIRWNEPELNGSARIESYEIKLGTNRKGWSRYNRTLRAKYGHFNEPITPASLTSGNLEALSPGQKTPIIALRGEEFNDDGNDGSRPGTTTTIYSLVSTTAPSEGMIQDALEGLYWQTVHVNIKAKGEFIGVGSKIKFCTYTINDLAPDTCYKFRVRAVAAKGHSKWSPSSDMLYTEQEVIDIRQIIWDAKRSGPIGVVQIMRDKKFEQNAPLQVRAIRGLRSFAITSKILKQKVHDVNGQEEIINAMQLHNEDLMVSRWGIRAITSLIEKEPAKPSSPSSNSRKSSRANALEDKIKAKAIEDFKAKYAIKSDSVNQVISCMANYPENNAIQQWCCEFIVKIR